MKNSSRPTDAAPNMKSDPGFVPEVMTWRFGIATPRAVDARARAIVGRVELYILDE